MVTEVADIHITPGTEQEFIAAYVGAHDILATTPGCLSVRMTRCVESPSRFVLLVDWDEIASHENNFRGTERFTQWRAAIGSFFAEPPLVEHFSTIEP
jgi:heme-degrading monooxygenase HmoA